MYNIYIYILYTYAYVCLYPIGSLQYPKNSQDSVVAKVKVLESLGCSHFLEIGWELSYNLAYGFFAVIDLKKILDLSW